MRKPPSVSRQHSRLVYAVADPVNRINQDPSAGPGGSSDYIQQRRASPVAFVLPLTREWSDTLPRRVRPYALCNLYPRIANAIAIKWRDKRALSAYFDELLVDRRRGRNGFPLDVLNDLCILRDYHAGSVGR